MKKVKTLWNTGHVPSEVDNLRITCAKICKHHPHLKPSRSVGPTCSNSLILHDTSYLLSWIQLVRGSCTRASDSAVSLGIGGVCGFRRKFRMVRKWSGSPGWAAGPRVAHSGIGEGHFQPKTSHLWPIDSN